MSSAQGRQVPRGLAGVSVTDTTISKSGEDGSLVYRGYPISELAANAGFEETAYLVLRGSLPSKSALDEFSTLIKEEAKVDDGVFKVLESLGTGANPVDALRTGVSALGSLDRQKGAEGGQASLEAKMGVLAANCRRVPGGEEPRRPSAAEGFAERLLRMLTTKEFSDYDLWAFERVLMFYMEHDLNASSFTVRVVASTLADPYAAATAGLAALKGPLHGGANEAAMKMLLEVREPDRAGAYVQEALGNGRKVIGFGHRVYKKFDPRARLCKEYLKEMIKKRGVDDRLFRVCDSVEKEMWERKKIPPNLDYYAAPIFYLLGIEVPLYTPIFASSRVFGWMAHYNEQIEDNKLIRPDATYVGPTDLKYVPVGSR